MSNKPETAAASNLVQEIHPSGMVQTLFLGVLLSAQVKLALSESLLWKQEQIGHGKDEWTLEKVTLSGKSYVGLTLDGEVVSHDQIHYMSTYLVNKLKRYIPGCEPGEPRLFCRLLIQ